MELERFETLRRRDGGGAGQQRGHGEGRRRDHRRPAGAAEGAAGRSLHRPRHPGRARRRRVLPRDLRPPRRGAPPEERGGRSDLRQEGRRADHAGVRVGVRRSDAVPTGRRRSQRLLPLRRRGRGRAARDAGLGRRAERLPAQPLADARLLAVERPRAAAGGAVGRLAPGEPGRRAEALRAGRRAARAAARRGEAAGQALRALVPRHLGRLHQHRSAAARRRSRCCRSSSTGSGSTAVPTSWCAASTWSARRWRRCRASSPPSDDYQTFNGYCGAESGFVPVSATSPSLLVQQIEVERRDKGSDKPPLLPAPALDERRPDPPKPGAP